VTSADRNYAWRCDDLAAVGVGLKRVQAGLDNGLHAAGFLACEAWQALEFASRPGRGFAPAGPLCYPGSHPAIVDEALFEAVHAKLAASATRHRQRPNRVAEALLKGRMFDADGYPMCPAFTHGARDPILARNSTSSAETSTERDAPPPWPSGGQSWNKARSGLGFLRPTGDELPLD